MVFCCLFGFIEYLDWPDCVYFWVEPVCVDDRLCLCFGFPVTASHVSVCVCVFGCQWLCSLFCSALVSWVCVVFLGDFLNGQVPLFWRWSPLFRPLCFGEDLIMCVSYWCWFDWWFLANCIRWGWTNFSMHRSWLSGVLVTIMLWYWEVVDDSAKMNACYTIGCDLVSSKIGYLGNCFIKVHYVYNFNPFLVFKYYVKWYGL